MIDFLINVVFNVAMEKEIADWKIIQDLGGPSKVAELLGFPHPGGQQRVQNWKSRGIPAQVKVDHPRLFMPEFLPSTAPASGTVELAPEGQGSRPAAELLTADPALSVELTRAEQAGLVKLPKQAPQWDGAERRVAPAPRR